ncbi:MAG: tyrosine-type recombinase/integrase [Ignavibacteria bacterium]|nr:tyrosine-type recombinase/integrase [Ignavibacteria bacterium]
MTSTEIHRVTTLFQRHLEKQKKNPNTVRSYTNDLQQFFKWCVSTNGDELRLAELTRSDVVDFRSFLLTRKSSLASINRRITSLRQFFEFAIDAGLARQNPVTGVMGLPNEPQAPAVLTRKDALLLVRTVEQAAWPMETSVLLLLLQAGMRSGEICGLTIGDLHLTPRVGRLFIKGLRKKTMRFVFLSMRAQAALRQYVRKRGISILARRRRAEPLFLHRNGSALTQQSIDLIVKRIGRDAGIPSVTPTMLRNTYAVQLLLQGESADAVKRALGVTSVKSYQRLVEKIKSDTIPF